MSKHWMDLGIKLPFKTKLQTDQWFKFLRKIEEKKLNSNNNIEVYL